MTGNELRSVVVADPFRPFRIRFGSGQSADVMNRDFILLSPGNRTAFVYENVGKPNETMKIVDVMLIESIEFLSVSRNGRRKTG